MLCLQGPLKLPTSLRLFGSSFTFQGPLPRTSLWLLLLQSLTHPTRMNDLITEMETIVSVYLSTGKRCFMNLKIPLRCINSPITVVTYPYRILRKIFLGGVYYTSSIRQSKTGNVWGVRKRDTTERRIEGSGRVTLDHLKVPVNYKSSPIQSSWNVRIVLRTSVVNT